MKKSVVLLFILSIFTGSLFAFDWGGVEKSTSRVTTGDFSSINFNENLGTYLWISSSFGKSGINFVAEGVYKLNFAYANKSSSVINVLDIDILRFSGKFGNMGFYAGRFHYGDITQAVYSQNIDGAQINYSFGKVKLSAVAGYTGLLNELNVSMANASGVQISPSKTKIYSMAYPYVMGGLNINVPVAFANQTIKAESLVFIDIGAAKTNRYYFNALIKGSLGSKTSYRAATSVETVDFKDVMNFTNLTVEFYPADFILFGGEVEYASGKQGCLTQFSGVTLRYAGSSACPVTTSSELDVKGNVSFVLDNMIIDADTGIFFDCADEFKFNGIDLCLSLTYQLFTDLQIAGKTYAYFDVAGSGNSTNYGVDFSIALAF